VNNLDVAKDRQEETMFVFTVITAIFLPLSTISSIFGMNTVDIRDMSVGQWAYWATALPVTTLILIVGLWWLGNLGSAIGWLGRKLRRPTSALPGLTSREEKIAGPPIGYSTPVQVETAQAYGNPNVDEFRPRHRVERRRPYQR
jgi:hypothetical protein